ncbi:hypothetical protein C8P64_2804 [Christiangramia gaetbulicola]|uniref:Phytase-like domain-containing protein n=1 Tax=Christiangramia gaetbulicola TaxID=703340 RepID=A0A2T6AF16_9FLAO|nr:esterase-like activity of phytase family protein [Christiangramia gaetbulicola]PTX42376.1 hypothetical protein C8P64_2804 [Christiangramia gaetbulicola]
MKKITLLCLISIVLCSCAVSRKIENDNVELRFLDEYVLPADTRLENTVVGGLSGIDYKNDKLFMVCDDAGNPRIYLADLSIEGKKIKAITLDQIISIKKSEELENKVLDLEAIRYDKDRTKFIVTSEGAIKDGKDPGIYEVSIFGRANRSYTIPEHFKANTDQRPRNNGVFEGITESIDNKGYWVAMELPLEKDGPKPKIYPSRSHVRMTKFNKETGKATKQFAYKLDGVSKLPINFFAVNGVTEILEYSQDRFLVLERSYSAGYGSHGNTVKIFDVDASQVTNILDKNELKGEKYKKAEKKLIFNFKSVKDQLTKEIIDNIEGMCFGPTLENGERSLILVSDNNFNSFAEQINQFILMQINIKNGSSVTD